MDHIYGFGPKTSLAFVRRWGKRTLDLSAEGLARLAESAGTSLTWMQRVGLRYHRRFRGRMPRSEVTELSERIRQRWQDAGLLERIRVVVCGSYRRRRSRCNDIDLLVESLGGKGAISMQDLLRPLRDGGLVPADGDLVRHPVVRYMGFCVSSSSSSSSSLSSSSPYRRLDIHLAAGSEVPVSLLALTGSADFNRAVRERARELGARLSARRLEWRSTRAPVPNIRTERDIFRFLGLPYVAPRHR